MRLSPPRRRSFLFFFNDTATTEIYTLSLHDALPICPTDRRAPRAGATRHPRAAGDLDARRRAVLWERGDRKSTRLNSSHSQISYAVFCLKKKKQSDRTSWTADLSGGLSAAVVAV